MLQNWFGAGGEDATDARAQSSTGNTQIELHGSHPHLQVTTRRTEQDVLKLVRTFQRTFDESPALQTRLAYFWPSSEFADRVLFTLAHDIPLAENPLWPPDPNEVFPASQKDPRDGQITQTVDTYTQKESSVQDRQLSIDEEPVSDNSFDEALGKGVAGKRPRRKKREVTTKPRCVEWLGLVNERNHYAAIKLTMPATFEPWITWTNRLIVFLFAGIPGYRVPEDFVRVLKPPDGGPFPMKCQNPRCVRLSHIDYLPPDAQKLLKAPQSDIEGGVPQINIIALQPSDALPLSMTHSASRSSIGDRQTNKVHYEDDVLQASASKGGKRRSKKHPHRHKNRQVEDDSYDTSDEEQQIYSPVPLSSGVRTGHGANASRASHSPASNLVWSAGFES